MNKRVLLPFLAVTISLFFTLALCEVGYRLWLFGFTKNFLSIHQETKENWNLMRAAYPIRLDKDMGWVPSPQSGVENVWKTRLTVLEDTTRSNARKKPPQDCRILAVGDSFTFGDQVSDDETWPSYLEENLGCQVINAGVCAYGLDQVYLRALQLIKIHKPQALIVGFIPDDVQRTSDNTKRGLPKPYFTLKNGELTFHPMSYAFFSEAQRYSTKEMTPLKKVLKVSYVISHFVDKYDPDYWWGLKDHHVHDDPVGVSCALMKDLDSRLRAENIQLFLFAEYTKEDAPESTAGLLKCLDGSGIPVIDTKDELAAVQKQDPKRYDDFFYYHMTARGNKFVADIAAAKLKPLLKPPLKREANGF